MSKSRFHDRRAQQPQERTGATESAELPPAPPETRPPVIGIFPCPDGPWRDKAASLKANLDTLPMSVGKKAYMRGLAEALAKAGNDLDKADAIYHYLAGA